MSLKDTKPFDFYLYKKKLITYQSAIYKTKNGKKPRIRDREADQIFQLFWNGDIKPIEKFMLEVQKIKEAKNKLNNQ